MDRQRNTTGTVVFGFGTIALLYFSIYATCRPTLLWGYLCSVPTRYAIL